MKDSKAKPFRSDDELHINATLRPPVCMRGDRDNINVSVAAFAGVDGIRVDLRPGEEGHVSLSMSYASALGFAKILRAATKLKDVPTDE